MPDEINTGGGNYVGGGVTADRDFIGRDQHITHIYNYASAYTPSALRQLPGAPEHFTGRVEELNQIIKVIGAGDAAAIAASAVQGKGGIGKTALAVMAGYALSEAYPDAQLFVELGAFSGSPRTAEQARDDVLRAFYPNAKFPDDPTALWNEYRAALSGKRGLMILDDALDDAQVQKLRPPRGWGVIITSRHNLSQGNPVPLDVLPLPEAVSLLRAICPRLSQSEAEELAGLCGRLPLALRIAGGFLKTRTSKNVGEYLRELAADRLGRLGGEVETVLERSWAALSAAQQTAWAALSIMPASFDRNAGIIVAVNPEELHITNEEEAAIAFQKIGEILDDLTAYNLLDYDPTAERFAWHDLLRELAGKKLSAEQRTQAQLRHAAYFTQVAWTADQFYKKGGDEVVRGLALFDEERAHLEAAFANLQKSAAHPELIDLVDAVVYTGQELRFHPRQRIAWLEAQRHAARASGHKQAEGAALGNLGLAYAALGETRRAIEFYEQCLKLHREIGDRRGEGADLGNLGLAYAVLGETRRAIEFYEQDLAIAREIGDKHGEGAALGNLGLAYAALGDARRAIEYHEQYLAIAREIGDSRGEGVALGNLGLAYAALGEPRRAIEFYEQDLTIAREIGDRRGEGAALGNLGNAYYSLGETSRAIEYHEQALVIDREIGDRRGEGADFGNLGSAYAALGDARQAIEFYEQQLKIAREIGDKEGEANASWNLGLRYEAQGDFARAVELMQVRVNFLRQLGHPAADQAAARVAAIRAKMQS